MTKLTIKRVLSIIFVVTMIIGACSIGFVSVSASEVDDTKQDIAELEEQSKKLEAEIKKLKAQKADKVTLRNAYQRQVNATQAEINACNALIVKYKKEIAKSEANIAKKHAEIDATKERFKKRIRSMHLNNTSSNIQILLGAETFSDFLMLAELSQSMSVQDQVLVDKIVVAISEIQAEIENNKKRQAKQDELKKSLAAKKAKLNQQVASVNGMVNQISKEEAELTGKNTSIEKQIAQKEAYLDSLLSGTPAYSGTFNGKFQWPVPGYSYISAYWQSNDSVHRGNHKGIDIAGGSIAGKKVVASAAGVVSHVYNGCGHNYGKNYSCGCGGGYGNNVRIDHGKYKGKQYLTIYANLKKSASGIKVKTKVKGGQTIGYVGTTGWSKGYHLHFGIAVNGGWVNPYPYVK